MKIDLPHPEEIDSVGKQIVIHPWDTWNVDITLSYVIVPLLKQLKETKHGAPAVSLKDVPVELHPPEGQISKLYSHGETDDNYFKRWDWVLDEMIFAFEQKTIDWEDQYYGPWVNDLEKNIGGEFEWINHDGLKAHQERMTNGFRLFGKYYENLWD